MAKSASAPHKRGLSGVQIGLLVLLIGLLFGSIGLRLHQRKKNPETSAAPAAELAPGGPEQQAPPPAPPTPLERALPFVTEGSFFALLGFALGYASRRFVRLGLILFAFCLLLVQFLIWTGSVSIDWGGIAGAFDGWLVGLKENQSLGQFLARRIPAASGLLLGSLFGFQR